VLPVQLWQVIRRYWAMAVVIVLVCLVGFVAVARHAQQTWHSTTTFNVLPDKASDAGSGFLAVTVPAVQVILESDQLKHTVRAETSQLSGTITTSVVNDPATGVLHVTVSSINSQLVQPALKAYAKEIATYGTTYKQSVDVVVLQDAGAPTQDSRTKASIIAGVEGLVFGLALAIFVALGLARFRRSRDQLGRLSEVDGLKTLVTLPEPGEPGAGREDEFVVLAADVRSDVLSRRASSFAVVSSKGGTSRSVVAAQLARGLAIAGHRVLLVDADLRTPRLEAALASIDASPIAPFNGMSWLPAETTSVPNLVIIRGGSLVKVTEHLGMQGTGPVRLVAGSIASLVGEARNANVVLVVDCPAVDGSAEATAVISAVDAAVIVTSGPLKRRDGERLSQLNDQITRLGTEVIGLVAGPKKDYNLRPVPTRSPV
jgi:Mrp family chromosome partitioning ATPase